MIIIIMLLIMKIIKYNSIQVTPISRINFIIPTFLCILKLFISLNHLNFLATVILLHLYFILNIDINIDINIYFNIRFYYYS
jgi:hypothetical protein